jgi:hypothetical protein
LMGRCCATKASGEPCRGTATGPHGLCWAHAPENAEQRRRGAQRGGRAKANRELVGIKALLSELTDRVLGAEGAEPLQAGTAAVANQLINTRLRAIDLERKTRETEELEERLQALERAAEERGRRWRA